MDELEEMIPILEEGYGNIDLDNETALYYEDEWDRLKKKYMYYHISFFLLLIW